MTDRADPDDDLYSAAHMVEMALQDGSLEMARGYLEAFQEDGVDPRTAYDLAAKRVPNAPSFEQVMATPIK